MWVLHRWPRKSAQSKQEGVHSTPQRGTLPPPPLLLGLHQLLKSAGTGGSQCHSHRPGDWWRGSSNLASYRLSLRKGSWSPERRVSKQMQGACSCLHWTIPLKSPGSLKPAGAPEDEGCSRAVRGVFWQTAIKALDCFGKYLSLPALVPSRKEAVPAALNYSHRDVFVIQPLSPTAPSYLLIFPKDYLTPKTWPVEKTVFNYNNNNKILLCEEVQLAGCWHFWLVTFWNVYIHLKRYLKHSLD